uniref:transposase n=2 Tax=Roseivirga sp. TaxID=1964215 RepID=UPI00404771D3
MIKTGKRINRRRSFSEDFKLRVIELYESGQCTVLELEEEYELSSPVIYRWIYKYSNNNKKSIQVVEMKDSQQSNLKELAQKVKELEQAVGRKQMNIDYLEKMIELAKDHYDIDIKKNFDTPPSGGSNPTERL